MDAHPRTPSDPPDLALRQMALQLDAAQSELSHAQRSHSEFLWAMGHALRSPLTAILGHGQLLDADTPASSARHKSSVTQILQAGWGLLALIDEILDVSLIEAGKLELQMEHVSLEDVLRDCETRVKPLARQSDARVEIAWPAQPLLVAADRRRLRQILMTLISHSLVHSGRAGVVQLSCQPLDGGRLRIYIDDTSSGLSGAWLADGARVNNIKLLCSRQLAGLMGGMIATESIAGTASDASGYLSRPACS